MPGPELPFSETVLSHTGDAEAGPDGAPVAPKPARSPGIGPDGAIHDPISDLLEGLNPVQREAVVHADGPAAGRRRRRVGQDPGADPPHRPPDPRRGRLPVRDPGHHVHQQGRRRDEATGSRALVGRSPRRCGCRRSTRRACASCGATPTRSASRRQFTIYDQADAVRLTGYVSATSASTPSGSRPGRVHAAIIGGQERRHRRRRSTPTRAQAASSSARSPTSTASTRRRLRKAGAMDFDDLLGRPSSCSATHPDVLEHYQQRFQHVLVDEYQDTNRVQNELVLLLAAEHRNICVVGDSDQCLPPGTMVADARGTACRSRTIAVGDEVLGTGGGRRRPRAGHVTAVRPATTRAGSSPVTRRRPDPRGTPHHIVLADPALEPGARRLPDGAGRPGLPRRSDQEHAADATGAATHRHRRPDATRSTPTRSGSCGSCDIAGRGGVLGGVLRGRVRAPDRCFHGSGGVWPWTKQLARLFDSDRHAVAGQAADGGPATSTPTSPTTRRRTAAGGRP